MTLATALSGPGFRCVERARDRPHDLMDLSGEAVVVFGRDGVIRSWNRAASALYGRSAGSVIGRPARDVFTDITAGFLARVVEAGDVSGRVDRTTGQGVPVAVAARWVRRAGSAEDDEIVELGRAEVTPASLEPLRESEARYRDLFRRAPVALMLADAVGIADLVRELRGAGVTDLNLHIAHDPQFLDRALDIVAVREVNELAMSLFGADQASDLVQPVRHLWVDSPETFRRAMIARFDGLPYFAEETRMRTLDGRTIDVLFSLAFPAPDEYMGAALMGMLDITERLNTEADLRRVTADFAQAARLSTLGEMTTSIAHEIKQPLSAILTNAQTTQRWLGRDAPNLEKATQLTTRIAQSARHASDIIDRIQDMAGARQAVRAPLDLNELVRESLLFIRHESDSRGVQVRTHLDEAAPQVLGDRVQLQQIVVNLVVNALQALSGAANRRGEILVTTTTDPDSVRVAVTDNGPGVAPANLDQIFDGFFTTKSGGLGIGLAICQSIITAHGGRITVSNLRDGGARFEFCVPLALPGPVRPPQG